MIALRKGFAKILSSIFTLILAIGFFAPRPVFAADCSYTVSTTSLNTNSGLTVTVKNANTNGKYDVQILNQSNQKNGSLDTNVLSPNKDGNLTFNLTLSDAQRKFQAGPATLRVIDVSGNTAGKCVYDGTKDDKVTINVTTSPVFTAKGCPQFVSYEPNPIDKNTNITATFAPITGSDPLTTNPASYGIQINNQMGNFIRLSNDWKAQVGQFDKNPLLRLYYAPNTLPASEPTVCYDLPSNIFTFAPGENPCKIDPVDGKLKCPTALGNIPTNPTDFVSKILQIATGLAGGIALIFMVIGSIKVLTSSGDQQKLTGGKDMIVAAVSGLLFLILSVLILRFIGTSILGGIPGLQ